MAVAAWREPVGRIAAAVISGRKERKVMMDVQGRKVVLDRATLKSVIS
jgi:hypothetical protein